MVARILADGPRVYVKSPWNRLDGLVVISSWGFYLVRVLSSGMYRRARRAMEGLGRDGRLTIVFCAPPPRQ